jgi:hypothetical protein
VLKAMNKTDGFIVFHGFCMRIPSLNYYLFNDRVQ